MAKVVAHKLNYPDIEEELDYLENESQPNASKYVEVDPDNVPVIYLESLRIIGFKTAQGKEQDEFSTTLTMARDYGVGLFLRGNIGPDSTVTLSLSGQEVTLVGGTSVFNTALNWLSAYGIARILRDEKAISNLCRYNVEGFEGAYDQYHITLVSAIMAYENKDLETTKSLLETALAEAHNGTMFPEKSKKYGVPKVELAQAVLLKREEDIVPLSIKALQAHCWAYSSKNDNSLAEEYIPFIIIGLCAIAHDRGTAFDIDSLYFPTFMVEGTLS